MLANNIDVKHELRPYQSKAITETLDWMRHDPGNPIIWAATGSGKSHLCAELCRVSVDSGRRVLMIVPSKELAEQNHSKLAGLLNNSHIAVVSASIRKDDPKSGNVIVSTIGTVARMDPQSLGCINLVIIDECHLAQTTNQGQYRKLISGLESLGRVRVVGLTATPFRGNGVWLYEGKEPLFGGISSHVGVDELLKGGYLAPLKSAQTQTILNANGVRVDSRTGDYAIGELARAIDTEELTHGACSEIVALGQDRKRWMVFCVTIDHAAHVLAGLRSMGVIAEMVTGKTPKQNREAIISRFRAGEIRCLVNVVALSIGFDVPEVDMIALLRNTRSPVLFAQIAGRGMRTADGKRDCLWADFTDSTARMGPVDQIKGRSPSEPGSPVMRPCPNCGASINAGFSRCPYCDTEIPREINRIKHGSGVHGDRILSTEEDKVAWHRVDNVTYHVHHKHNDPSATPSMRVEYRCGLRVFKEWVCVEHYGRPRSRAIFWWARSVPDHPFPDSVIGAVSLATAYAKQPARILVDESGKYPTIKEVEFKKR